MKKLLLFALGTVCAVSASGHRFAYSFDKKTANVATESNYKKAENNHNYIWIIPAAAKQQDLGRGNEKGLIDLNAKYDYYYRWDNISQKNTDLATHSVFDNLDFDNLMIKVVVGSNCTNAATAGSLAVIAGYEQNPHVGVRMLLTSTETADNGNPYTVTVDFGTAQDDVTLLQELTPVNIDFSNTADGKMFPSIQEIRVIFDNVRRNNDPAGNSDWVYFQWLRLTTKSAWQMPQLDINSEVAGLATGEIRIQAEDFDEPWINGYTPHSNTVATDFKNANDAVNGYLYSGRDKAFDETCDEVYVQKLNHHGLMGLQHFNGYVYGHGTVTGDSQYGFVNFAGQMWDAPYSGPLQADGSAMLDDLADFYGAWTEYTVNVAQKMEADISLRTAMHLANNNAYRGGSSPSPKVSGENVNYMQKYGGAYRIFVDGKPVQAAMNIRPAANINDMLDFDKWLPNELPSNRMSRATAANNADYFAYSMPNLTHQIGSDDWGTTWSPVYRSEMAEKLLENGTITDEQAALLSTPDFVNVPLSAGQHTIRVQAMGGQTTFDEIKVQAHKSTSTTTGIEDVAEEAAVDADAPVEYFNLQGIKVAGDNLRPGVYVKRQGNNVQKILVK